MSLAKFFRQWASIVKYLAVVLTVLLATAVSKNAGAAPSIYFDINGATAGSGVANNGAYSWESAFWSTNSAGSAATGNFVEGDFTRFAAGTDAGTTKAYTVTANSNHTIGGMFLQASGGGSVTINGGSGVVLSIDPTGGPVQGFIVNSSFQTLTINASLGGAGGVENENSGSLNLYGNNSYSGGTVLGTSAGLNFNNSNSFGTGAITMAVNSATLVNPTVAGITIANSVNMTNTASSGNSTTITYTGMNSGTNPGATFSNWTLASSGATAITSTLSIGNSSFPNSIMEIDNGVKGAAGSALTMSSSNSGTLIITGASTYGGATTIASGTLSVASVGNNNGTGSTGKNGTINFGATTTTGKLVYTGAGETSDKVLNLAGTTGGAVIDQSGTGLLKFTSNLTATGAGSKTLTLQGSTAGTGEIVGKIVDNTGTNTTAVLKQGSGMWTLDGANTYTGGTTVIAGTLGIGGNNALSTGSLTLGGTSANAPTIVAAGGARTIGNNITLAAVTTGNATIGGTNKLTINGTVTNNGANRTLAVNNSGGTIFSTIDLSESTGTGRTLTFTGTGNMTLGGVIENVSGGGGTAGNLTFNASYSGTATINGPNTYSGATTLSAGTFVLGDKSAFGTSTVGINGVSISASTDLSGANAIGNTVTLGGNNSFTGSNNVEFSGSVTETGSRTITNNISNANLTLSGGVSLSNSATNRTLTVTGSGNTLINSVISNGASSASSLIKDGGGILTLTGTNIYSGGTTINNGTLLVNGTSGTGSGAVTVNTNGILGGSGSIAGNVNLSGGSIAPGNSPGALSIGGNLNMTSGTYSYQVDSDPVATADRLNVTGNLSIAAGAITFSPSDLGSTLLAMGTRFTVINYGGTWNNGTFIGLPNHSTSLVIGLNRFQIDYDSTVGGSNFTGGDLGAGSHYLTITAVPEAGAFLTVGLGGIFAIATVWMGKRMGINPLKSAAA